MLKGASPEGIYRTVYEDHPKIYKIADLEVVALRGLDPKVKTRGLMAIVSASGSGKSTRLSIIGGPGRPLNGRGHASEKGPP